MPGAWSARSTPGAEWRSTPGAERFRHRPVSSSLSVRSTPRSIYGGVEERSLHDAETALGATSAKLAVTETKLSSAQREIVRLRGLLEARERDLKAKRLVDRSRAQQGQLANEIELNRELRKAQEEEGAASASASAAAAGAAELGGVRGSAATTERVGRLVGRLQQEQEAARVQKREVARLHEEAATLRDALDARGDVGTLQKEVARGNAERMALALEIGSAKEAARQAVAAKEVAERSAAAAQAESATLRGELAARDAALGDATAAHARSEREASAAAAERAALASRAEALAADLAAAAAAAASLRDERAALAERAAEGERRLAAATSEAAQREEDHQVELGLLAERHEELRRAAHASDADAEAARERARARRRRGGGGGSARALAEEVSNLTAALDLLAEQHEAVKAEGETAARQREAEESSATAAAARLAAVQQSADARHAALTERLEALLRELQGTLIERDRLKAALDETLTRCASAVVHQQLAESARRFDLFVDKFGSRAALEQQLAAALARRGALVVAGQVPKPTKEDR